MLVKVFWVIRESLQCALSLGRAVAWSRCYVASTLIDSRRVVHICRGKLRCWLGAHMRETRRTSGSHPDEKGSLHSWTFGAQVKRRRHRWGDGRDVDAIVGRSPQLEIHTRTLSLTPIVSCSPVPWGHVTRHFRGRIDAFEV